jgi:sialic acid synthase SpsE
VRRGKALDEADVAKVRSRFQVSPQDFRVILVGKDGTVKRTDSKPIEQR